MSTGEYIDRTAQLEQKVVSFYETFFPRRPSLRQPWNAMDLGETKKYQPYPLVTVEVMGLMTAGKSTYLKDAVKSLSLLLPGVRIIVYPEFNQGHQGDRYRRMHQTGGNIPRQVESYFVQNYKLTTLSEARSECHGLFLEDLKLHRPMQPTLLVIERGPHDAMAWEKGISLQYRHLKDVPQELQVLYDKNSDFNLNWNRYIFPNQSERDLLRESAIAASLSVDAVILYGISFREARRRREKDMLDRQGREVNRENWPYTVKGYAWWLQYMYPWTEGTALLTVDGEQPLDFNNKRVDQFIVNVVQQKFTETE